LKYSIDMGNGHTIMKENNRSNPSYKQKAFVDKENVMIKTDRVASSDFKNVSNLRAPQKMFSNKTGTLLNNYLKNTEDDLEELIRKKHELYN